MKCNSCGGTLRYDVARYGLVCDFCGSFKPLHRPEEGAVVGEMDFASAIRIADTNWGVTRRLVTCKSCGAQMLYDSDQMSAMCPFCGSAIVLSAEEANCGIAPNAIIPFSITKEQVTERFYRWNKFAFWSPEKFRKGKVLGNATPVYIPYWTFDADAVTTYSGKFGYTTGSGDSSTTSYYIKTGICEKHIDDYCVCGSRKFSNDQMLNSVAKFKPRELMAYSPEILSGMPAEIYTIGIDEAWVSAKNGGLRKKIADAVKDHEHADSCTELRFSTEYYNVKYRYVLVPVWLSGCRYGGQIYNVAASGHNGKGNCTRPLSIAKFVTFLLAILACFALSSYFKVVGLFVALGMAAFFIFAIVYAVLFFVAFSEQRAQERMKGGPG